MFLGETHHLAKVHRLNTMELRRICRYIKNVTGDSQERRIHTGVNEARQFSRVLINKPDPRDRCIPRYKNVCTTNARGAGSNSMRRTHRSDQIERGVTSVIL
jgi:hypothetical protein